MHRAAVAFILVILLMAPAPALAQGATPSFEQISGILGPVRLLSPWQCGACVAGQAALERWPDPAPPVSGGIFDLQINPLYPFQWLAVQLWNNAAYPIICWMLAALQALLNALSIAINVVFVNGLNFLWRLLIALLLWLRDSFLALWSLASWGRGLLWDIWAWLLQLGLAVDAFVRVAGELLALLGGPLAALAGMIINAAQALLYLLGLFMALIPGLVTGVTNPVAPPQLALITDFFLFVWMIDTFRAIADSSLGWAWIAFIAITYLRFAMWLLDELATLNQ